MEHRVMKYPALQHSAMEHPAMEHRVIQYPAIQHSVMENPATEHRVIQYPTIQHYAMEDPAISTLPFSTLSWSIKTCRILPTKPDRSTLPF
jgi:hypothetical protein